MKKYLICIWFLMPVFAISQSIGIGNTTPNSSAMLDITSTTKGLLIPRMTQAQRNAISTPAAGLMIYQTDNTPGFYFYNGSVWNQLSTGSTTNYWSTDGTNIYNNNSGKVWVGTSSGTGSLGIKAPVSTTGGYFFMSETGTSSSDFLFAQIYPGGGTTSTRVGAITGNFGNGFSIGNQSNGPLMFQAVSERMRILSTGEVGINTTTPTAQLEVKTASGDEGITHTDGTIRLTTMINSTNAAIGTTTNHHLFFFTNNNINSAPPAMTISTAGNVGVGGIIATDKLEAYTADAKYGITHTSSGGISIGTYIGSGAGWLGTKTNHPLYLYAYTGASFIALLQNGNLGIGTTTPAEKLTVYTPTNYYGLIHTDGNVTVGTFAGGSTVTAGWLGTKSNHPLAFFTNNSGCEMILLQNGNVGIGTINPTYKLSVNGSIQSKEVRVETGWADFVFEKNYKLKSLNEVEKFIQQNKHLPDIPSADEIQKNGLAVGDTQTKMMQKIEELTLYIIDLQKQITDLKNKIDEKK